jgi:hypothetical protein
MPRNSELQRYRDIEGGFPISVTASAAELNLLDGVTSTTAELNILDTVTSTAAELNKLDGFSPLSFINTGAAVTAKSDNYEAVLADANTCLNFGTASGKTFTIPANSAVAFPVGTIFIVAKGTNNLTLAVTTDTLIGCTGTVVASTASIVIKVASTTWVHIATA